MDSKGVESEMAWATHKSKVLVDLVRGISGMADLAQVLAYATM